MGVDAQGQMPAAATAEVTDEDRVSWGTSVPGALQIAAMSSEAV